MKNNSIFQNKKIFSKEVALCYFLISLSALIKDCWVLISSAFNLKLYQWTFCLLLHENTLVHLELQIIVTSCSNWPFGNYWVTPLCSSFNCWHFSLVFKKSHLLISTLISSEQSLLGLCYPYSDGYKFSKILIFTWKLKFYHWNKRTFSLLELTG